jgi:hypothetical protein
MRSPADGRPPAQIASSFGCPVVIVQERMPVILRPERLRCMERGAIQHGAGQPLPICRLQRRPEASKDRVIGRSGHGSSIAAFQFDNPCWL